MPLQRTQVTWRYISLCWPLEVRKTLNILTRSRTRSRFYWKHNHIYLYGHSKVKHSRMLSLQYEFQGSLKCLDYCRWMDLQNIELLWDPLAITSDVHKVALLQRCLPLKTALYSLHLYQIQFKINLLTLEFKLYQHVHEHPYIYSCPSIIAYGIFSKNCCCSK